MAEPEKGPDGLESMAFQLVLHKVTTLEHAMQGIPPLLKKIIDHLEAQTKQPDVPIATYVQLYPELQEDVAEAQASEEQEDHVTGETNPLQPVRPRRFWHWFVKEG